MCIPALYMGGKSLKKAKRKGEAKDLTKYTCGIGGYELCATFEFMPPPPASPPKTPSESPPPSPPAAPPAPAVPPLAPGYVIVPCKDAPATAAKCAKKVKKGKCTTSKWKSACQLSCGMTCYAKA